MLEESNYSFALFWCEVVAAAKYTASLFYRWVSYKWLGYPLLTGSIPPCLPLNTGCSYRKPAAEMNYMSLQIARERMKRQRAQ